jgi:hypothetical protein
MSGLARGQLGHPTAVGAPPQAAGARLTTRPIGATQEPEIHERATGPVETELNPDLPDQGY